VLTYKAYTDVVGGHDYVVGRVEPLAVVTIGDDCDTAVECGAHNAPGTVLARDEPALTVHRLAVRIARGGTKHAEMVVVLQQPHLPVVRMSLKIR
jgi:hypothetical protein